VCPHARAEEAVAIAERLRAGLAETAVAAPDGTELLISASLGVGSAASGERLGVEELVARADTCLYEAKAAGRNVVKGPHP
jgi:diguanylate cyclase (GGDEF)-like protein